MSDASETHHSHTHWPDIAVFRVCVCIKRVIYKELHKPKNR